MYFSVYVLFGSLNKRLDTDDGQDPEIVIADVS